MILYVYNLLLYHYVHPHLQPHHKTLDIFLLVPLVDFLCLSDLDDIRSGATAGATALQEDDLQFATDGDIDGLFT